MDDKYKTIDKDLYQAYQNAPAPAKAYIDSGKLEAFVEYLRTRMNLTAEQALKASNELVLALLGITDPLLLADNLEEGQELPSDVAKAIAQEAQKQIFDEFVANAKTTAKPNPTPTPPSVLTPPPPINRLAPPPKVETPPVKVVPPPVPPRSVITSVPVVPKPVSAPIMPPPPKPMTPPVPPISTAIPDVPPLPPIVAPRPSEVIEKKRPGEPSPARPSTAPSSSKADPYREVIE